jgi:hypothetical protein
MFKGMSEEQYQDVKDTWHAMQIDRSTRSPYGELRTAEESGHNIHKEQPGLVVEAVHTVWKEVHGKGNFGNSPASIAGVLRLRAISRRYAIDLRGASLRMTAL